MKIANKKIFIRGIILFVLAIVILLSRFFIFKDAHGFPMKAIVTAGICVLASIYHLGMALHVEGEDDKTEEEK